MVYTLSNVYFYMTPMEYKSARKCRWKFWCKFHDERAPSRQAIHNLVNKLRTMGFLIDEKQKHKCRVLTEKLDNIGARLEHLSIYLSIYLYVCLVCLSTVLGDLGRFFSFLIQTQLVGLLEWGISPLQGRYLHRINTHRHPCLEWDLNPWSQCSSRRRRFLP
jgi:hypothetical protein